MDQKRAKKWDLSGCEMKVGKMELHIIENDELKRLLECLLNVNAAELKIDTDHSIHGFNLSG